MTEEWIYRVSSDFGDWQRGFKTRREAINHAKTNLGDEYNIELGKFKPCDPNDIDMGIRKFIEDIVIEDVLNEYSSPLSEAHHKGWLNDIGDADLSKLEGMLKATFIQWLKDTDNMPDAVGVERSENIYLCVEPEPGQYTY